MNNSPGLNIMMIHEKGVQELLQVTQWHTTVQHCVIKHKWICLMMRTCAKFCQSLFNTYLSVYAVPPVIGQLLLSSENGTKVTVHGYTGFKLLVQCLCIHSGVH